MSDRPPRTFIDLLWYNPLRAMTSLASVAGMVAATWATIADGAVAAGGPPRRRR